MDLERPLFIIGNPRSGTSLLRLLLTSHSAIVVPPECGFILWLHGRFCTWSSDDSQSVARRAAFLDSLFDCRKFNTWGMVRDHVDACVARTLPKDYASLCACIHEAHALARGRGEARVWGDKNNFHIHHLPALDALYPQARFLHIVRDGRDVACSYREVMRRGSASPYAPRLNTDLHEIAAEWSVNVMRVDHDLATFAPGRSLLLRYEDLVLHPQEALTVLCGWLGLPFEAGMLAFHQLNRNQALEPAATLEWKQRTLEPISADTVGRYRVGLSADELAGFACVAGHALARFGYPG